MRLIHTSDWHIGRTLYGRKRYAEFEGFLDWLLALIEKEAIDALLVAGDVFDNTTPSHRAQALYYRFLYRVAGLDCRHVVVVAGNHDSPSFLEAPRELLRHLNVHVVGQASGEPADDVLVLNDAAGGPELIVCAVPYLRDRDLRQADAGESLADKERKLTVGIRHHYQAVCAAAEQKQKTLGRSVPIVAMGHLFTAGGRTVDGDGVRELYVGSLAHVAADVFPPSIDYLALGHLHVPQRIGDCPARRYAGSPLPMGFGEATQEKSVCLVTMSDTPPGVSEIPIPRFQALARIRGDWDTIAARLDTLKSEGAHVWLEIDYDGQEIAGNLRERLDEAVEHTGMEILRVKNNRVLARALRQMDAAETLDDLDVHDVFARCLDAHGVPDAQRPDLMGAYSEALAALYDDDTMAE